MTLPQWQVSLVTVTDSRNNSAEMRISLYPCFLKRGIVKLQVEVDFDVTFILLPSLRVVSVEPNGLCL